MMPYLPPIVCFFCLCVPYHALPLGDFLFSFLREGNESTNLGHLSFFSMRAMCVRERQTYPGKT